MSEILLEPAELSYLLQAVSARSVIGVNNTQLFPQDEAANQSLLKLGFERLQANGWLLADEKPGKMNMNETLVYLAAVMADPEMVVVTTHQKTELEAQVITHYLMRSVIVEQIQTMDSKYRLGVLPDIETTIKRIEASVEITDDSPNINAQVSLNKQEFAQIKDWVKGGQPEMARVELQKQGVDQEIAISITAAVAQPNKGIIVIFERENWSLVAKRSMMVMRSQGANWLLRIDNVDDSNIILEPLQAHSFTRYLIHYLSRLSGQA